MFTHENVIADSFRSVTQREMLGLPTMEAEDVSGRTSAEIERVLYARVAKFDFLERANGAERQEQWSIKVEKNEENAGSGSIRVRKSINLREPGAAIQYVLTSKLDVGSKGASAETPEQSSLDQLNIFKYLGNKGMLKDRYYFPIEATELQWEIDCFQKPGAMYHEWIKIDLEKWPRGKELPSLPFDFIELIDGTEGIQTPENAVKIKSLYDTIFLTKNTNQPLADYGNTAPDTGDTDEEGQAKTNDQGAGDGTKPPADGTDPNAEPPDSTGAADDGSAKPDATGGAADGSDDGKGKDDEPGAAA